MATFTQLFDDSAGFTFNASEVEFIAGVCRLLDLGGGTYVTSSEVILPVFTNDPVGYIQNAAEVNNSVGTLAYQLSVDGVNYVYWDGAAWSAVPGDNNIATVSAQVKNLFIPGNDLYVKIILKGDGSEQTGVDQLELGYPAAVPVVRFRAPIFDSGD